MAQWQQIDATATELDKSRHSCHTVDADGLFDFCPFNNSRSSSSSSKTFSQGKVHRIGADIGSSLALPNLQRQS